MYRPQLRTPRNSEGVVAKTIFLVAFKIYPRGKIQVGVRQRINRYPTRKLCKSIVVNIGEIDFGTGGEIAKMTPG
jgi:hypothetical protein